AVRAHLGEVGDEVAVRGGRVGVRHHQVVGPRHVVSGDRLAVGPLHAVPDGEGPGQLVRRGAPGGGQSAYRVVVGRVVVREEVVHQAVDLGRQRALGQERRQGVDTLDGR